MKNTIHFYLVMACLAMCLFECSKKDQPPVTPPVTPPVKNDSVTIGLGLIFSASKNNSNGTFELIVSTTNGNKLLDTLAPINTPVVASVRSDKKLVDVTVVHFYTGIAKYSVNVFRAVDPTGWDTLMLSSSYTIPVNTDSVSAGPAHVTYINPPGYTGQPIFNNYSGTGPGGGMSYNGIAINVDYNRYPSSMRYLMLPDQALYKFTPASQDHDTVDLSTMEQGKKATFDRPGGFQLKYVDLYGVMDPANFNKTLHLFNSVNPVQGAEIAFPRTQVTKYHLNANFSNSASKEDISFFSYGDSVATFVDGLYVGDYMVTNSVPDDVELLFYRKPGYYMTSWSSNDTYMNYYASADSSKTGPEAFVQKIKSKILATADVSHFFWSTITMERSPQGTNYQQYLDRSFKASQRYLRPNWVNMQYSRQFQ
jgi:hypothetical protein